MVTPAAPVHASAAASQTTVLPRRERRGLVKFMRNRAAVFGAALVLLIVVMAVFAPWLSHYDPVQASFMTVRQAPSAAHWFGTDELGRDVLSRLLWGARASLLAGVVSVCIAVAIGVPLGLLAGYFGKLVDGVISRIADALLSIPFLILAIALAAFLGPSLTNAMAAIGISAMPRFVRLTRGQAITVKAEDYVEGARAIGLGHARIIVRYILPNVLPPIIVQASLTIATAIIAEASLSFLGLGQLPPSPSWGSMLNTAKDFVSQAPWMSIFPGIAIFLAVLGFNLLGDGLRDALDPRES
ncbi:putative D,D-dipeptide transport system permease protein DdpC [Paraburkholderia graminis C4D1M]|jgi:peptide/nickel transport system permease protein|uniref:Binding-protein-dependent transport systems inner membrane component n=1 Tax=Paraburkholderia graminis (strain ATCC 700544 / DSM 17151 / LMG 18924 / NCIMB 13744 / C4D1M) TaxID=396598 RepID=B1G3E5_PARG4|nr:ABC transporter permease [Paraburkholderia graminis]EDT09499.1 binding-protein-dependent transport systems inner membrane component [Paraburkholderia graminis C4D1M]CAB3707894.1 putative D,D-dipeptide transport system permease protein DdpC [Paraburkholderia graminis C4D1M]